MTKVSDYKIKERKRRNNAATTASLDDVARHAGVSTATVSRVLNNPEIVSEKSREVVNSAINILGYIPDGAARALASRHTSTIGAVVPTLDNAIFAAGIQGLQKRLKKHGYTLFVASHEYDLDEEFNEVRSLLRQGVDGILLIGANHKPELPDLLRQKNIPFVNCWTFDSDSPEPNIGFDNQKAAKNLAEYLLDLGHKEIAIIAGHTGNNDRAMSRLAGFKEALKKRGIPIAGDKILERAYSVKQGREAMRILLKLESPPTAVICGNDILALGAIFECQFAGIKVPEEMSVSGFDDLSLSSQIVPAMTTVRVPAAEMGEQAAEFLISQIRNESTLLHIEIGTDLMVRDTTSKPRDYLSPMGL
jgi:LacI family transcriptional regulator